MPTLRESIQPVLLITVAAAIVMFLIVPLEATEWAAGVRAGFTAEVGDGELPGGVILFVAPLIKIPSLDGDSSADYTWGASLDRPV